MNDSLYNVKMYSEKESVLNIPASMNMTYEMISKYKIRSLKYVKYVYIQLCTHILEK